MKHIVTITFNPAVDKSTSVPSLIPEHKMKASSPDYHAGGGGINIVRALANLGLPATAFYFKGGHTGKFLAELLAQDNVNAMDIEIQESTRENFVVNELTTGKQFKFGLPAPEISMAELDLLLHKIKLISKLDYLVVSGSLPPSIPLTIFGRLKSIADEKGARMVVDTSGPALESALACGVFLIKPSLREMADLTGKTQISPSQAIKAAKKIVHTGQCKVVVISMGASGAVLVTHDEVMQVQAPPVNPVNTVGAGDSMVSGILFSLNKNENLHEALQFGVACGSAATLNHGTELCDKAVAEELFNIIRETDDLVSDRLPTKQHLKELNK